MDGLWLMDGTWMGHGWLWVVLLTRDMRADASSCTQGPKRPLSMASSCSVTTFWGHSTAIASHLVVSRPWCSAVGRSVRKRVAERNRDTSRLPPLGLLHACWSVARCHWRLLSDGLLVHAHAWRWACAHGWHTCMYMARSDDGLLDGIVEISRLALGQRPTEDDGGGCHSRGLRVDDGRPVPSPGPERKRHGVWGSGSCGLWLCTDT